MMTLNLWRAEWLKTRKRLANRSMLGLMLAITLVVFAAITVIAYIAPGSDLDVASSVLPFPGSLAMAVDLLANLGGLIVVIFAANSVGSEYGRDTWKVILPRHGSRPAFLVTKWVAGLVALVVLVAAMIVSAVVLGWLGTLFLGITADPASPPEPAVHLRILSVLVLEFIFVGTLTLLGAIATRSTVGAAIVGIVSTTILSLIGPLLSLLVTGASIIVPTEHLNNLQVRWAMRDPELIAAQTAPFNGTVPPVVSALVVLLYIVLLLGASLYIFRRRDMAGE